MRYVETFFSLLVISFLCTSIAYGDTVKADKSKGPDKDASIHGLASLAYTEGACVEFLNSLSASYIRENGVEQLYVDQNTIEALKKQKIAFVSMGIRSDILKFDVNLDSSVTREEIFQSVNVRANSKEFADRTVSVLLQKYDANRDNVISRDEILAGIEQSITVSTLSVPPIDAYDVLQSALALDPNKDGKLTIEEFQEMVGNIFKKADVDGNGCLSKEEAAAVQKERQ